ncbi:mitochondrial chaperone bcs1 [Lasiosphaeria ovina]|uniref:Mitochondrial chaperone bcs1 n=1 Tax=Lasiosphaeria ovina TaxID=92902 RepID=A0AAE0K704_9PEZI|nr:mitochondrial chaperone bcs1 [Lasiosphaeria ovina]
MSTIDLNCKEEIIQDINGFLTSEPWYYQRGIPFRRGYLFHGPPGTGKTSFVSAIAASFGLPIFIINARDSRLTDDKLGALFKKVDKRCIIILDDIDGVGRPAGTAVNGRDGISLSGLLTAIDGVSSHEGHVLIMTTNKPDELGHALVRPGRIDKRVQFNNATSKQAMQCFQRIYGNENEESNELAKEFSGKIPDGAFSIADIQGFLIENKNDLAQAVENTDAWDISLIYWL